MKLPYTLEMQLSDSTAFLNSVKLYSDSYFQFFSILREIGCRYSELKYHMSHFEFDTNFIRIYPLKGGQIHGWYEDQIKPHIFDIIKPPSNAFWEISHSTACYYFKTFYPQKTVLHETKSLRSHLFRHTYAKFHFNQGKTREEIKLMLGEIDIKNSNGYIDSELYYIPR